MNKKLFTVSLTGAAGNIGSTLVFQLLQPGVFSDEPYQVRLKLAELPDRLSRLKGLAMEAEDSFFDTLHSVEIYEDCLEAFSEADCVILCGARPRTVGMERKDLLGINAKVIERQAKLINETANEHTRVLVVGNPSNTNALIFSKVADKISKSNISSLSHLDLNRALRLIEKTGSFVTKSVKNVRIYGNHSKNMLIDVNKAYALIDSRNKENPNVTGPSCVRVIDKLEKQFIEGDLQKIVQQRGLEIIKTLGCSASYSAAYAIKAHLAAWFKGSDEVLAVGRIVKGFMDTTEELCITLPVVAKNGSFEVTEDVLEGLNDIQKNKVKASLKELSQEKRIAFELLELN